MNRTALALRARIATRAYYLTLDFGFDHLDAWLTAERVEADIAKAKRKASAAKAAVTRKAKAQVAAAAHLDNVIILPEDVTPRKRRA